MPFLELVGITVIIIVFVGLSLAGFTVVLVAGGAFVVVNAVLGWLPIFIVGSDPDWLFRWVGGNFIERWAFVAILEYIGLTAVSFVLFFTRPDPDGLPPGWKFLALFYTPRAAQVAYAATGDDAPVFRSKEFIDAVKDAPSSLFAKRMEARKFEAATEHVEAEHERRAKATKLAEASIELERVKARQEVLEEFLKKHDK